MGRTTLLGTGIFSVARAAVPFMRHAGATRRAFELFQHGLNVPHFSKLTPGHRACKIRVRPRPLHFILPSRSHKSTENPQLEPSIFLAHKGFSGAVWVAKKGLHKGPVCGILITHTLTDNTERAARRQAAGRAPRHRGGRSLETARQDPVVPTGGGRRPVRPGCAAAGGRPPLHLGVRHGRGRNALLTRQKRSAPA